VLLRQRQCDQHDEQLPRRRRLELRLRNQQLPLYGTKWAIESWIDFTSPNGTAGDNFEIDIDVQHPDYSVSRYTLLYWNGADGSISACGHGPFSTYFYANTGDTVTITVRATNSGNATIVVSTPRLFQGAV
jgi:hypothetical protein